MLSSTGNTPKRRRGRPRKYDATPVNTIPAAPIAIIDRQQQPALISVKQAAETLNVSTRTIANLIQRGHLSDLKILDTRRVPLADVLRLATTGTAA